MRQNNDPDLHPLAAVLLLTLAVLLPSVSDAAPAGQPCVWHVRLAYHYQDAGPQGKHDTQLALAMETPLRCVGSGAETALTPDGPTAAHGSARRTGVSPHPGSLPVTYDSYDKRLSWPAPGASAGSQPGIDVPAPSFVGPGFGTKVVVAGALAGEERSGVAGAASDAADMARAGPQRGPYAALDAPPPTDRLDIALYFDPLPGVPSDPNGELGQVPQRTREALAVPGGEAALALKGHLFGATTVYNRDGNFSICYRRHLVLAPAAVDVDYCGWLTRAGQEWAPERLPPLDATAGP